MLKANVPKLCCLVESPGELYTPGDSIVPQSLRITDDAKEELSGQQLQALQDKMPV